MNQAYAIGEFAADIMLKGVIQKDFKLDNIGFSNSNPVFVDYADCVNFSIPNELNEEFLREISESLFSLIRSLKTFESVSTVRAGLIAKGGILADIAWRNLSNNGVNALSYKSLIDKSLKYDGINELKNEINRNRIIQWKDMPLDNITIEKYRDLVSYKNSDIRKGTSSFLKFHLDRLYYIRCYNELIKSNANQIPIPIMNMGVTAFRDDKKYCAFGLLNKCIAMSKNNTMMDQMCEKSLRKLIHTKRLSPKLKKLILENLDLEFFELLWLLDDIDTFEKQL